MKRDPYSADTRSEYEHTDISGSQDHIAREYNTQVDEFGDESSVVAVSTCEVCGESIPPTSGRCNTHQRSDSSLNSSSDEWSISRVAIAVIPGATYYHAVSIGAAAFRQRNNQSNSTDSFDLIYDFDNEPSKTLTRQWGGELSDAVRLDSEEGTELFETGIRKTPTLSNTPSAGDSKRDTVPEESEGGSDVYIYLEDGTPIRTKSDLEAIEDLRVDSDQPLWVVTAVLYQQTTQQSRADRDDTRRMYCEYCAETEHIHRGSRARGEWECLGCGTTRPGLPPGALEMGPSTEEMRRNPEQEQFQEMMTRLYEAGKLPFDP